jgi:hypothetical protein
MAVGLTCDPSDGPSELGLAIPEELGGPAGTATRGGQVGHLRAFTRSSRVPNVTGPRPGASVWWVTSRSL